MPTAVEPVSIIFHSMLGDLARQKVSGINASHTVNGGEEFWELNMPQQLHNAIIPKTGDRIIPVTGADQKTRTISDVKANPNSFTCTCPVPAATPAA